MTLQHILRHWQCKHNVLTLYISLNFGARHKFCNLIVCFYFYLWFAGESRYWQWVWNQLSDDVKSVVYWRSCRHVCEPSNHTKWRVWVMLFLLLLDFPESVYVRKLQEIAGKLSATCQSTQQLREFIRGT